MKSEEQFSQTIEIQSLKNLIEHIEQNYLDKNGKHIAEGTMYLGIEVKMKPDSDFEY